MRKNNIPNGNTFKNSQNNDAPKGTKNEYGKKYSKMLTEFGANFQLLKVVQDNLGFSIFIAAIIIFNIWNSHLAEKQVRKADALSVELKELKSEFMTHNAHLSKMRKQSEVSKNVVEKGISPLKEAPFRMVIQKDDNQKR